MRGATPVCADIDSVSQNLTAETISAAITPRTRAVVVVHLAGWPCDMDAIIALCRPRGIVVIEDCAQAHGARYKGRPVGSFGDAAAFSFCQDKIITTGGEGGMLLLDDTAAWEKAWAYKDHGKSYDALFQREHPPGFRWVHESFGSNWRMTEMQAVIGRLQLRKLADWSARRRQLAGWLADGLDGLPGLPRASSTPITNTMRFSSLRCCAPTGDSSALSVPSMQKAFPASVAVAARSTLKKPSSMPVSDRRRRCR